MAATQTARDDPRHQYQPRAPNHHHHHHQHRDRLLADASPNHATKRLFSNRSPISDQTSNSEDLGEDAENNLSATEDYPSGKRQRPAEWPLTSTSPNAAPSSRTRHRNRETRRSPPPRRSTSTQARASKFIEGSMNDRVSQKPPATYIGNDEDLRDRYDETAQGKRYSGPSRKFTHHPNNSLAQFSATDASHNSSIFRFGKSLAATFNPTNWKIWIKDSKQETIYETDQQRVLRERQDKAEKIYKELKRTGRFHDGAHSRILQTAVVPEKTHHTKHDSGVEFGHRSSSLNGRMSTAEKRMGRIFVDGMPLPEPSYAETPRSLASSANSPRKSFQFKKPSLPNIRRSLDFSSKADSAADDSSIRKIPSRRDLQKQQKLVKRVSDLEGKLEAARRQLSESMREPLPSEPVAHVRRGRSQFVPGGLSTLPSERLLSGYISDGGPSEIGALSEIGKAVTTTDLNPDVHNLNVPNLNERALDFDINGTIAEPSQEIKQRRVDLSRKQHTTEFYEPIREAHVQDSPKEKSVLLADKVLHRPDASQRERDALESPAKRPAEADIPRKSIEHSPYFPRNSPPTRQISKKRKSAVADDSGTYRHPGSEEEDIENPGKKRTPPKKKARKVEKTTKEPMSTPDLKKTKMQSQENALAHFHVPTKMAASSSRLTKIPPMSTTSKQSTPPLPSSEFEGLEYLKLSKPMASPERLKSRNVLRDDVEPYSAVPGNDADVPPMPKLPTAVRLPSGEVINPAAGNKVTGSEARRKYNGKQNESGSKTEMDNQAKNKQSFEWERDTF